MFFVSGYSQVCNSERGEDDVKQIDNAITKRI
jgi:hypothetical protein